MSDEEIKSMISDLMKEINYEMWQECFSENVSHLSLNELESLIEIAREHMENAEG